MGNKQIPSNTSDYNEYLIESLANPDDALAYLQVALEEYEGDNDIESFLIALRNIVEANGGIGKLADKTNLNRQNIYRILSSTGNPRLQSLNNILNAMGFRLSVTSFTDKAA